MLRLKRHVNNPILARNSDQPWEAGSVLNPSVLGINNDKFAMLYRATNDIRSSEAGGYVSSIGLAYSTDGLTWNRDDQPLIKPDQPYENSLGCEDPRITAIKDRYYIFYTAVSGYDKDQKVRIALATTKDFASVTKHGVIGPDQYSKAGALFPRKINGKYVFIWADQAKTQRSRIICSEFASLDQLSSADSSYWAGHNLDHNQIPMSDVAEYSEQEVGAVPIETPYGWLLIYAGISLEPKWSICAALLDLEDPRKVIATITEPLLMPESSAEVTGVVNNVCFPEGAVVIKEDLYVYYGSGDQGVCLATCKYADLISELKSQ